MTWWPPFAGPVEASAWSFVRSLLTGAGLRLVDPGRDDVTPWLLENAGRVRLELAAYANDLAQLRALPDATERFAARSTLFRDRGIALDTSLRPAFAIDEALRDALARGLLAKGSVRRVAVVGPGLDFVDKAEGQDYYPPQSLQALALVDSLVRLGLSRADAVEVTAFDISPQVLDHLTRARQRAAAGEGYVLQLPRPGASGWGEAFAGYWRRFGEAIGGEVPAVAPPKAAGPLEVRAVRVRPGVVGRVLPVDLNVVFQRLELDPKERFDLVVATNILVYYDTFEQCLALANLGRMTAVGGLLLSNNILLELPDVGHEVDGLQDRRLLGPARRRRPHRVLPAAAMKGDRSRRHEPLRRDRKDQATTQAADRRAIPRHREALTRQLATLGEDQAKA